MCEIACAYRKQNAWSGGGSQVEGYENNAEQRRVCIERLPSVLKNQRAESGTG
jgi:hypothetical protein